MAQKGIVNPPKNVLNFKERSKLYFVENRPRDCVCTVRREFKYLLKPKGKENKTKRKKKKDWKVPSISS